MNIEQAIAKKRTLETDILALIKEFETETKCEVTDFNLLREDRLSDLTRETIGVQIKAELPRTL